MGAGRRGTCPSAPSTTRSRRAAAAPPPRCAAATWGMSSACWRVCRTRTGRAAAAMSASSFRCCRLPTSPKSTSWAPPTVSASANGRRTRSRPALDLMLHGPDAARPHAASPWRAGRARVCRGGGCSQAKLARAAACLERAADGRAASTLGLALSRLWAWRCLCRLLPLPLPPAPASHEKRAADGAPSRPHTSALEL